MASTFLTDLKTGAFGDASIRPQAALTASANGGAIDCLTTDGPTSLIVTAGATDFASTDETYAFKLQESDDGSTNWTDIVGATVSITAANTTKMISTGYQRSKRYVRAVVTIGGTTPSILCTAVVIARKKVTGTGSGVQL